MPADGADSAGSQDFLSALARMGLLDTGEKPSIQPLTGGVSSDIVRVDLRCGTAVIKRALAKLKVQADWQAPVERNRWEVEWMKVAADVDPDAVPRVLGEDAASGMFAMTYLDEQQHPVWKARLRDGHIEAAFAAEVGQRIGSIHAATARRHDIAQRFATDHIFFPIRLEPYLSATARSHPDCAARLHELVRVTGDTKLALVHGDVSPKNILCGPRGPVFLDAECAWYGDPVFDLAFCLNHMLLKCLWRPQWTARYLECFDSLKNAYLEQVDWEAAADTEMRTAALLPGLFLARVDGKSPAEYIDQEWQRDAVRTVARRFLLQPSQELQSICEAWRREMAAQAPTPSL